MVRLRSECRFRAEPLTDLVQVIREELLPEKYIEVKKSIRGDPTKAESFRIYPAVMNSRVLLPHHPYSRQGAQ